LNKRHGSNPCFIVIIALEIKRITVMYDAHRLPLQVLVSINNDKTKTKRNNHTNNKQQPHQQQATATDRTEHADDDDKDDGIKSAKMSSNVIADELEDASNLERQWKHLTVGGGDSG
jgi:hypothetical protein